MSAQTWWDQLPFWTIFFAALAFGLGAFAQDLFNKKSWIWVNIRSVFSLAEIKALRINEHAEWCTHVSVDALLKFSRELKNAEIFCTVKHLNATNLDQFVIYDKKGFSARKDETLIVPVCRVRAARPHEPPLHSLWGCQIGGTDLKEDDKTIMPNGHCLIMIHIKDGMFRQKLPFRLHFRNEKRLDETLVYSEILDPGEWSNQ